MGDAGADLEGLMGGEETRATRCLRPTVLYTDFDGQCHKLVTETVTSLPH